MLKSRFTEAPSAAPRAPTAAERLVSLKAQAGPADRAVVDADAAYDAAARTAQLQPGEQTQAALEAAAAGAREARARRAQLAAQIQRAEYLASPEYARRWRDIEGLLKERAGHAATIQKLAPDLFTAWEGWSKTNARIRAENVIQDEAGACISQMDVIAMFKLELARVGFGWAANTGFLNPALELPPLADRVTAANQHAIKQKAC